MCLTSVVLFPPDFPRFSEVRRNQVGLRVAINEIANELAARPACMSRTRSAKEMSEMPLVRFDNVVLRFDDTTILDGINLKIWIRDRLVILGQSGSGKSTHASPYRGHLTTNFWCNFLQTLLHSMPKPERPKSFTSTDRNGLSIFGFNQFDDSSGKPRLTVGRAGSKIARRDRGDGQRKIGIGRDERHRGQVSGRIKRRYAKAHQPGTGINDGPGADPVRRTVRGTGSGRQVRHRRTYY